MKTIDDGAAPSPLLAFMTGLSALLPLIPAWFHRRVFDYVLPNGDRKGLVLLMCGLAGVYVWHVLVSAALEDRALRESLRTGRDLKLLCAGLWRGRLLMLVGMTGTGLLAWPLLLTLVPVLTADALVDRGVPGGIVRAAEGVFRALRLGIGAWLLLDGRIGIGAFVAAGVLAGASEGGRHMARRASRLLARGVPGNEP